MDEKVESTRAPEPVGLYPHARRVGDLLFLSGVGPRERGTKKIPGVELDEAGDTFSHRNANAGVFQMFANSGDAVSWDKSSM